MMTPFLILHTRQKNWRPTAAILQLDSLEKTFFRRPQIRVASAQDSLWAVDYIYLLLGPFHQYQSPTDRMKFAHLEKKDL